ncbi:putative Major facilitator superfamily (MFS) profile domain-containing protein [Seiridium cardinale]
MGFLGIIEPKNGSEAPGTVLLDVEAVDLPPAQDGLKYATGTNKNIVLVPQPSNDPNDPLNFPPAKKLTMIAITGLGTCIWGTTIGPLLNAGLVQIATELEVSVAKVVQASGYQLLVVAASVTIINTIATKWGKRPVFVASGIIGMIGNIIGSTASSFNQLLTARIIQGFSSSAYESLIFSMIGDLFYVHERGIYAALFNFIIVGISNFSSVICGAVTAHLGWKYLFHLLNAFGGFHIILQYLFVPETQFIRPVITRPSASEVDDSHTQKCEQETEVSEVAHIETRNSNLSRKTYRQSLALINGEFSDESITSLILGPFVACINLSICWVVICTGYILSLYVTVAYLLAQIFSAPPYLLDASGVGYLSLGPFIGGLLAGIIAALLNDRLVRWCSHKNCGIYEPEYRLLLGGLGVIGIAGFVGFGYAAEAGASLYLTAFCHGIALFGIMFIFVATSSYALDAFPTLGNEIFLASMAFKNLIIYAFSYFVNDWAAQVGVAKVLWILSAVGAALFVTFPIMFFFGKRYRVFWHNHDLLSKFYQLTRS